MSAKRCPECGKAAMLQAFVCNACGHRFRTRFVEPQIERTEAFTLMAVPPVASRPPRRLGASRTYRAAFLSGFLLVALAGALFWLVWKMEQPPALMPVSPPASVPGVSRAMRLYRTIGPTMSLYDLDEAAGGTGRVIHVSDPHTLLLSYDYPYQSVRVSLSRLDVTGGDYQVQAVALYRGNTLLECHAAME